ncbi:iron(III) transport system ATP-binding protein [Kitasatospora sp. MAP12-15]|uniref:ABC transporter ATP-binding protein n=1 Tax=unclassified Kitasatospora TaxID=2633591 RepID=UPI002476D78F|nr:ABC transporter ATP-binding protein [Kitasatospora sp. MAP12-44]MDH6108889.1 iron(III) transport system ATP-binding protein [Kitasatospora sp. MAP12-44]
MTSLKLSGVVKSYGRQGVLHGVDLDIPAGSLAAVLGPSGSGKTTLLRVIAGFERADSGAVSLGGKLVDDGRRQLPPERRKIGYVPQDGGLFPHLTVVGNVAFGLPGRARRHTAAVGELLERVGLAGLPDRYPHQLSGGQQQRVALARALAIRPEIVLLDEPFSALDAGLRASIRADVQAILREFGATAVLVTHDQDEALSMADLVAVVRDGRIAQCATPRELYQRPADAGLAAFVGEANLLPGTPAATGEVRTALGTLALHDGVASGSRDLTVLLRPEQIEVHPADQEGVLTAVVTECRYHGHDAVVRCALDGSAGPGEITARLTDAEVWEVGSKVALRARGPVTAWPTTPDAATPAPRLDDRQLA